MITELGFSSKGLGDSDGKLPPINEISWEERVSLAWKVLDSVSKAFGIKEKGKYIPPNLLRHPRQQNFSPERREYPIIVGMPPLPKGSVEILSTSKGYRRITSTFYNNFIDTLDIWYNGSDPVKLDVENGNLQCLDLLSKKYYHDQERTPVVLLTTTQKDIKAKPIMLPREWKQTFTEDGQFILVPKETPQAQTSNEPAKPLPNNSEHHPLYKSWIPRDGRQNQEPARNPKYERSLRRGGSPRKSF